MPLAVAVADELGRSANRLKAFALSRDAALQEQRRSLARDLHDSVAQSLAGMKFWLHSLHSKVEAGHDPLSEITSVRKALDGEHANVRRLIAQLRQADPTRELSDLFEDLERLVAQIEARWAVTIAFDSQAEFVMVAEELSFEVQQLIREGIANAVRHGGATHIKLTCAAIKKQRLELEIEDDGRGFAADQSAPNPRTIAERVARMAGSLQIETRPGRTRLRISIPIGTEN